MAYVDQSQSKEKTVSLIITLIIILGVGYAFVTGLAYNVVKNKLKDLKVLDVQDQPPPPPEPPPPPPEKQPDVPPPPVSPPPIVQPPPMAAPPIQTVTTTRVTPIAPPAPPKVAPPAPPAAPSLASGVKPKGNPGSWASTDDYPPGALRNEEQGRTGFKLDVDGTGRATNCAITSSSGHPDLDDTTCKLMLRRARFTPAKDAAGNGVPTSWSSSVLWQIPKD